MSLRMLPRALQVKGPKNFVPVCQLYRGRRYADIAAKAKDISAEQVPTSRSPSSKEVPLTVDSHGPVTQNPNLSKKVLLLLMITEISCLPLKSILFGRF